MQDVSTSRLLLHVETFPPLPSKADPSKHLAGSGTRRNDFTRFPQHQTRRNICTAGNLRPVETSGMFHRCDNVRCVETFPVSLNIRCGTRRNIPRRRNISGCFHVSHIHDTWKHFCVLRRRNVFALGVICKIAGSTPRIHILGQYTRLT